MDGHDQAHTRPSRGESTIRAIVKRTIRPTFRMSTLRIWRASKTGVYIWSIQQGVIAAAGEQTKAGMQDVRYRRGVAIQPIQTDQHLGDGQRKSGRVPGGGFQSAFQFAPVVAITRSRIGANPLMRRGL